MTTVISHKILGIKVNPYIILVIKIMILVIFLERCKKRKWVTVSKYYYITKFSQADSSDIISSFFL